MTKKRISPEEQERRMIQSMVSQGISPLKARERIQMMKKARANKKKMINSMGRVLP